MKIDAGIIARLNRESLTRWERSNQRAQKVPMAHVRAGRVELALMPGRRARAVLKGAMPSTRDDEAIDDAAQRATRIALGDAIERKSTEACHVTGLEEVHLKFPPRARTPALERWSTEPTGERDATTASMTSVKAGAIALYEGQIEHGFEALTRLVADEHERTGAVGIGQMVIAHWRVAGTSAARGQVAMLAPDGRTPVVARGSFVAMMGEREVPDAGDAASAERGRSSRMSPRSILAGERNAAGRQVETLGGETVEGRRWLHAGAVLKATRMTPVQITSDVLAQALAIPQAVLDEVLAGREPMSVALSMRLGKAFGDPPMLWHDIERSCAMARLEGAERVLLGEVRDAVRLATDRSHNPKQRERALHALGPADARHAPWDAMVEAHGGRRIEGVRGGEDTRHDG